MATTKGQGGAERGPARRPHRAGASCSGPFDAMKYEVDYSAVATDLAKSKVGERAKEAIEKNQRQDRRTR